MGRRTVIRTMIAAIAMGGAVLATPALASAGGNPPVQLDGSVNDEGNGKLSKKGAATIDQGDFFFDATFVKVKKSVDEAKLTIENVGDAPHTFTIDELDIDEELSAGDKVKVTVDVDGIEAISFYCRFHVEQGMQGALYTKKGAQVDRGQVLLRSQSTSSGGSSGGGGGGSGNRYGTTTTTYYGSTTTYYGTTPTTGSTGSTPTSGSSSG